MPGNPTTASPVLWCVHIPGPDDLYAWPNREMADDHAARLNAFIRRSWKREPEFDPTEESMTAVVIPWPGSQDSHATAAVANVKAECKGNA
jgi:hypothetical protein